MRRYTKKCRYGTWNYRRPWYGGGHKRTSQDYHMKPVHTVNKNATINCNGGKTYVNIPAGARVNDFVNDSTRAKLDSMRKRSRRWIPYVAVGVTAVAGLFGFILFGNSNRKRS